MKRMLWVCLLVFGLKLSWTLVYAADFYVIPTQKKNYAPVPKTGQTECYNSASPWETCTCGTTNCPSDQDGDLEKGVTWPNPRFTKHGNGTVTDNLTGLIWMENANCFGTRLWANALSDCKELNDPECGLNDGSLAGDWRLPSMRELHSLIDLAYYDPALSNAAGTGKWTNGNPFSNVQLGLHWSSTTNVGNPSGAWVVYFSSSDVGSFGKLNYCPVWCVRDAN